MVFSSGVFLLLFLPAFCAAYALVPGRWRVGCLLLFSLFFYAYGEGERVGLLVGCGLGNWWLARRMEGTVSQSVRRRWLGVAVAGNLALLGWFKYADFLVANVNTLWRWLGGEAAVPSPRVALPLGISFFVFQGLSYVADVFRRETAAGGATSALTYLALFPQLVAGPIVRHRDVRAALASPPRVPLCQIAEGAQRFIVGLAKKVLLADALSVAADLAFATPTGERSLALAWMGAAAYSLQIYFDFSGYSDMAIGLGRALGFAFPENFAHPYLATSMRDFWRRWHQSLSSWFRDYVYIPLGGSRRSPARTALNLLIVFLLTGLWHGASWTFVAWGLWHGVWLMAERALGARIAPPPAPIRRALTLLAVLVGWVLFRAEGFGAAGDYLATMLGLRGGGDGLGALSCSWGIYALLTVALLACGDWAAWWGRLPGRLRSPLSLGATLLLLLLSLGRIGAANHSPFLYFRF